MCVCNVRATWISDFCPASCFPHTFLMNSISDAYSRKTKKMGKAFL